MSHVVAFSFTLGILLLPGFCHLLGELVSAPFVLQIVILTFPFPLPPPSGSCRRATFYHPMKTDLGCLMLPDPFRRKENKTPEKQNLFSFTPQTLNTVPLFQLHHHTTALCLAMIFLVESCLCNPWALLEQPNFTSIKYYDCIDFHHKSYFPSSVSLSLHWLN